MAGFNSPSPNWTHVNLAALPGFVGTNTIEFVVDAFSPKYLGTGSAINGWIVTANVPTGTIYRITDIGESPTLTAQKTIGVGLGHGVNAQFERGVQNWGIVLMSTGGGTEAHYTTDGTNWTTVLVNSFYDTWGPTWFCGLALDPHTPGQAYLSTLTASGSSVSGSPPSGVIMKTTNYGASWSSTGISCGYMKAGAIVLPYARPNTLFHGYRTGSGTSVHRLYRSVIGGAQTDISPVVSGHVYGVDGVDKGSNKNPTNRQISVADDDPNYLILVGTSVSANKRGVFLTRNALAATPTWTTLIEPVTLGSELYLGSYFVNRSYAILFGRAGNVGIWTGGSTVVSKKGDLSTSGNVVGLCGL